MTKVKATITAQHHLNPDIPTEQLKDALTDINRKNNISRTHYPTIIRRNRDNRGYNAYHEDPNETFTICPHLPWGLYRMRRYGWSTDKQCPSCHMTYDQNCKECHLRLDLQPNEHLIQPTDVILIEEYQHIKQPMMPQWYKTLIDTAIHKIAATTNKTIKAVYKKYQKARHQQPIDTSKALNIELLNSNDLAIGANRRFSEKRVRDLTTLKQVLTTKTHDIEDTKPEHIHFVHFTGRNCPTRNRPKQFEAHQSHHNILYAYLTIMKPEWMKPHWNTHDKTPKQQKTKQKMKQQNKEENKNKDNKTTEPEPDKENKQKPTKHNAKINMEQDNQGNRTTPPTPQEEQDNHWTNNLKKTSITIIATIIGIFVISTAVKLAARHITGI